MDPRRADPRRPGGARLIVRVKSSECDRCDQKDDLEVVSLHKAGGAVVSPRGHTGTDLGHMTLCGGCQRELQGRGFVVTIMPKAVAA